MLVAGRVIGLLLVLGAAALLARPPTTGAESSSTNQPPRLSNVTSRVGPVYLEGGGKKRGVKGTYRLCDDGPQSRSRRFGLLSITHRWGDRSNEWLLVRERFELIAYDIYFGKPECRARIFWSSTIPADLPYVRSYPCYSVALRVRDPGGRWSNIVTRTVKKCQKR